MVSLDWWKDIFSAAEMQFTDELFAGGVHQDKFKTWKSAFTHSVIWQEFYTCLV